MKHTTLVIPCYNEAARLEVDTIGSFVRQDAGLELVMVDDGSRDETPQLLDELSKAVPDRIRVLKLPGNVGKAEAVRLGMLDAFNRCTIDGRSRDEHYVGFWDADLATPLEAVADFQEVMDHDDQLSLVMGSRILLLGHHIQRKAIRHVIGRAFATLASQVLSLPVYDTQCGAKLFRVSPGIQRVFAKPFRSSWIFDVEILARMICLSEAGVLPAVDRTIAELPLKHWVDVPGSRLRIRDFAKAAIELLGIGYDYRWRKKLQTPLPSAIPEQPKLQPINGYNSRHSGNQPQRLRLPDADRRAA